MNTHYLVRPCATNRQGSRVGIQSPATSPARTSRILRSPAAIYVRLPAPAAHRCSWTPLVPIGEQRVAVGPGAFSAAKRLRSASSNHHHAARTGWRRGVLYVAVFTALPLRRHRASCRAFCHDPRSMRQAPNRCSTTPPCSRSHHCVSLCRRPPCQACRARGSHCLALASGHAACHTAHELGMQGTCKPGVWRALAHGGPLLH